MGTLAAIKLGLGVSAFALVLGGGFWFIHHERDVGAAKCVADIAIATDTEKKRQSEINDNWAKWADGAIKNADTQKATYDAKVKQIAAATVHDHALCLRPALVDQLRSLSRPRSKAPVDSPASRPRR